MVSRAWKAVLGITKGRCVKCGRKRTINREGWCRLCWALRKDKR